MPDPAEKQASTAATIETPAPGAETSPAAAEAEQTSPAPATQAPAAPGGLTGQQRRDYQALWKEDEELRKFVQSRADRLTSHQFQRWMADQQARDEAEARRREEERLLNMDPLQLGEETQERLKARKAAEPEVDRALRVGMTQGEMRAFARLKQRLEGRFPEWAGLPEAQKNEMILGSDPNDESELVEKVIDLIAEKRADAKATKKADAELAKFRQSAEREKRAEQRQAEPNPDLGGGTPTGRLTRAAIAQMTPDEYRANRNRVWEELSKRR